MSLLIDSGDTVQRYRRWSLCGRCIEEVVQIRSSPQRSEWHPAASRRVERFGVVASCVTEGIFWHHRYFFEVCASTRIVKELDAYVEEHYSKSGVGCVFVRHGAVTVCIESHQFQPKNFWYAAVQTLFLLYAATYPLLISNSVMDAGVASGKSQ